MNFNFLKTILFIVLVSINFISWGQVSSPKTTNFDDLDSTNHLITKPESITTDEVADVIDSLSIDPSEIPSSNLYQNWNNNNVRTGIVNPKYFKDTLLVLISDTHQFVFPYKGKICSTFGPRGRRNHAGVDIKLNKGEPVVAAFDGVVRMAKNYSGYGKLVVIRHYNGLETVYGHLSKISVKINQKVKAGDLIGLGGRTGRATTEHLHFETRYLGATFHPQHILNFETFGLAYDTLYINRHTFKMAKVPVRKKLNSIDFDDDLKIIDSLNTKQLALDSTLSDTINNKQQIVVNKPINNINKANIQVNKSNCHVIQHGDTLYAISRKYHVPVEKICDINKIKPTDVLSIGQKINLK